jgi:hypothetical protein
MPIALFVIGVIFLVAAVRGKQDILFDTLKDDFAGPNNFIYWGVAIWVITAVGYIKALKPLSHAFLVLVFLAMFIRNKGFFEKFMEQIRP